MDDPRRLYADAEAGSKAITDALKKEYAESSEAKKLDELAEAVRRLEQIKASIAQKKEPNQHSATPRRGPFQISSRQLGVADQ